MPIPDYQTLMLPLLRLASDGREHTNAEAAEKLAAQLNLADEDRREMLPSGQTKFSNRIGWARTYLGKACLLESAGRARFKITKRGRDLLETNPSAVTNQLLDRYAEFREFRERTPQADRAATAHHENGQTPEEILASTYQTIRRSLADDLLKRIREVPPSFFEALVVDLLVAMGYGGSRKDAGQALGRSGDGGVDGIIKEDKLGLDVVYVQAKRWKNANSVGRPDVQAFAGSLEGHRARKGVFITTSKFTQDAIEYIQRIEKKIVLINGEELAQLMIDHNIGVSEIANYPVKKIDNDYFEEAD
jgi:restriction system protein